MVTPKHPENRGDGGQKRGNKTPERGPPATKPANMETVTPQEYSAGEITDAAKLGRIREAFLRDGIAVVQNCVPAHICDQMGERLDWDAAHQVAKDALGGHEAFRAASGHLACGLPRVAPHVFPEVVANPIIEQLAVTCLGGAAFIRYYNGNTSLPGSEPQGLHMDGGGWSVKTEVEAAAANLSWPHEGLKLFVKYHHK